MSSTLEIFGSEYTGVNGIKAYNDNNQLLTFVLAENETATITSDITSKSGTYNVYATRCGTTCTIYINSMNGQVTSGSAMGTLPVGYRPSIVSSTYVILPIYSNASPYTPCGSLWITAAGVMTPYFSTTPNYVCGTYLVELSSS